MSFRRKLGDAELSYFLPSRADGVNDMYLHIGFTAHPSLATGQKLLSLWALLRLRHPLLASSVSFSDYEEIDFEYEPPASPQAAIQRARGSFSFISSNKDELISHYLNGPRTLGSDHLSHLFFSSPLSKNNISDAAEKPLSAIEDERIPNSEEPLQFDILIAATHYLGDGMALHNFTNEFFTLLSSQIGPAQLSLGELLKAEWSKRCASSAFEAKEALPSCLEDRLPPAGGPCKQAVGRWEFQNHQRRLIGGHSFPKPAKKAPRNTIVPTVSYPAERTKPMLKKCKSNGVSLSAASLALCGITWSRMDYKRGVTAKPELPLMIYSALNMRPYLKPLLKASEKPGTKEEHESVWFLAVGYFNVVLPSFLPGSHKHDGSVSKSDLSITFWERARSAKNQSAKAAKSPFVVSRAHVMTKERRLGAIQWAKVDDGVEQPPKTSFVDTTKPPPPPSQALIGVSLLGNLDGIYKHGLYAEAGIRLHTLTTGSRQRSGAMLLFVYTFGGKLWLSLGYDENGFEKECVGEFWKGLQNGVQEFLED